MTRPVQEWLETDGLGGFSSLTSENTRTRRYHALLLVARNPPIDRRVLVNGVDAVVDHQAQRLALTSQTYKLTGGGEGGGEGTMVRHEGRPVEFSFELDPWPPWTYQLGNGVTVIHQILVPRGAPMVVLSWRVCGADASR